MLFTTNRLIFAVVYIHLTSAAVQDKFVEQSIVSDVVPRAPKNLLRGLSAGTTLIGCSHSNNQPVRFSPKTPSSGAHHCFSVKYGGQSVNLGNELNVAEAQTSPSLDWPIESGALYTILMVDPDAPSRMHPFAREWRHWLVVNVKSKQISSGTTLTSYQSPSPPPSSGLHRYVLLVYKQKTEIKDTEWSDRNRSNWQAANFASKHQLGDPVAGNFFQSKG